MDPPREPTFNTVRHYPDLQARYKDMYIPSDVCRVDCHWRAAGLLEEAALPLTHPIEFKISKPAERERAPAGREAALAKGGASAISVAAAEDKAAPKYSAKVMLMSGMNALPLFSPHPQEWKHPEDQITFLCGRKGKNELCAIGGFWDPVDGPTPQSDPSVLVRTAQRTHACPTLTADTTTATSATTTTTTLSAAPHQQPRVTPHRRPSARLCGVRCLLRGQDRLRHRRQGDCVPVTPYRYIPPSHPWPVL